MIGILFSLFPLFGYGIADYVTSRLSNNHNPAIVNFFMVAAGGGPLMIFCLFFGAPNINLKFVLSFFVVSLIFSLGFILLVKAFSNGATGIVAPISNSYALVTLLIAITLLGVETELSQAFAVVGIVIGIALLTYEKKNKRANIEIDKSIVYALLAMLFFGVGFASFDVVATQAWYQNTIMFEATGLIISFLLLLIWPIKEKIESTKAIFRLRSAYIGSTIAAIGGGGLFIAIANIDNVSIPAAIAAASPLVTIWLARVYDKEHLSLHQYAGALFVVVSVVILSFTV